VRELRKAGAEVLVKPPDNPPEVMRDLLELTHHKAVEMGEQT
jgi:hypothetical protein